MDFSQDDQIHDITSAQKSLTQDQEGRKRRYFISMMVRTACFIAAVITPSPFRWIFLVGALLLPYFAVVIANAGRERSTPGTSVINEIRRSIS